MLLAILPEEEQAEMAAAKKAELVEDCEAELGRVRVGLSSALEPSFPFHYCPGQEAMSSLMIFDRSPSILPLKRLPSFPHR